MTPDVMKTNKNICHAKTSIPLIYLAMERYEVSHSQNYDYLVRQTQPEKKRLQRDVIFVHHEVMETQGIRFNNYSRSRASHDVMIQ